MGSDGRLQATEPLSGALASPKAPPTGHVSQPWEPLPEPIVPPPTACWGQLWCHLPTENHEPIHPGGHPYSQLPRPYLPLLTPAGPRTQDVPTLEVLPPSRIAGLALGTAQAALASPGHGLHKQQIHPGKK